MKFIYNLIFVLTVASSCQPQLEERTIFNPILPDFVADPSVVMFNDTFYLYGTTDIDQGLEKMGIPVVWKSTNFADWSFEGELITGIDWRESYKYTDDKGSEKNGYFRYWAPGKPLFKNGTYYLFPTIVTPDTKMGTYVMMSDKPEGPFHFAEGKTMKFKGEDNPTPLVGDIDGEPFVDDDGKAFIYWRRRHASKVSANYLSQEGETMNIPTKFGGYSEGPVMFKRNDIYYYVYTLSGHANYCNGYMMSKKSPLGPFETPGNDNIFIHSNIENQVWGPGHGNVFQMPGTDDFYFLYLEYGQGGTTRQVYANKIEFNEDGTIKPMELTQEGVGYLVSKAIRTNLAKLATATASSNREGRLVKAKIIEEPNNLKNLRVNTRAGEEVKRPYTYDAQNVLDENNGTYWQPTRGDESNWLKLDFGKSRKLDHAEIYFLHPTFGHSWKLEKSKDGMNWETVQEVNEKAIRSPHVSDKIGRTRFLRLKIIDGPVGVFEVKVY